MSLSILVPFVNGYGLLKAVIESLERNIVLPDTEIVALDNGSTDGVVDLPPSCSARIVSVAENIGNYPVFAMSLSLVSPNCDLIAIFHSDLFIHERGFDRRIREAFTRHSDLGLLGFVGSNEIDSAGGRGSGTVSNFRGFTTHGGARVWTGSPAEAHGRRSAGLERAAVVDGCAMVFRASVLKSIPQLPHFPPHHFYDRLLSCQVMERGFRVGVLGIGCDHISGQTTNSSNIYFALAKKWCGIHLGLTKSQNWDHEIYRQAEARWLHEYRDRKHFIPLQVPVRFPECERKLNLGCDTYSLPGFLNADLRSDANITPDVLLNVHHLPFPDETFDFMYAGHLLEHLYYDLVPEYLAEWHRALVPGGRLTVVVPDVG